MKFLYQNKIAFAILAILFLLVLNYNVISFGVSNDFFGIFFSVILFFIGGRKTNIKINYWLVGLIVLFEFISFRLHTKSLHFLSIAFFICLIYYSLTKKFSFIAFICILLFSTVFNKFFEHLTTEIKQILCYGVYHTLKNFIEIDKIEGVNFYINGARITIDTACMGLSMFKTGLLAGAILLTIEEKKQNRYFGIIQILIFCLIVILLNIVANYFRIIALILLKCTEENLLHHAIGLFCFVVYQVVPMLFLIHYFKPTIAEINSSNSNPKLIPIAVSFLVVLMTSIEMKKPINHDLLTDIDTKYNLKEGNWVNDEVFKIETTEKLIYIKTPSHKPLICWTGDGYKILQAKEILVDNQKVWFNVMEKDSVFYKSLWWYECGNKKYTSFLEVMLMKLIYNKPIRLINEVKRIDSKKEIK
ncbi:MAG: exosortase N [Bacteroidetes bacterium HGW-Bacteroidetes-23]|nr:MAG: exosortase N [Bacteroidetes bacterium HGW-Bacteroidetes-23]